MIQPFFFTSPIDSAPSIYYVLPSATCSFVVRFHPIIYMNFYAFLHHSLISSTEIFHCIFYCMLLSFLSGLFLTFPLLIQLSFSSLLCGLFCGYYIWKIRVVGGGVSRKTLVVLILSFVTIIAIVLSQNFQNKY